ncbi:hypothetical protein COEREDRAFT_83501 [Coemansia reversa NRRL 1564]|uniref:Uncharacterized protein n=1 Tax=Coemansia reversa (strain ATCC 12441 / NRRL 1564) TaxID=763665 RepID=A0A2G5B2Z2_COERN|nr:hypothetical protein COEREDRAFT_83501 [Coemansia reversa NRRL 1564]|eukprot:PIA13388.1 hypothetical protein COEREDRAFT_83501 [Coemansia reversa NRRL 1564]
MRRRLQNHTNTPFQVFADTSTGEEQPEHHAQYLECFRYDSKTLSQDDAAQRTTDKDKPFILSPRSRVNSQKENFDFVKMQLVSCGRIKSTKQPEETRARVLQQRSLGKRDHSNRIDDRSLQPLKASQTWHWPVSCLSGSSRHDPSLASPDVDALALVLSDVVIENSSRHSEGRNLDGLTTVKGSMLFSSKAPQWTCPKPANGARQNRPSCSNIPAPLLRLDTNIEPPLVSINGSEGALVTNAKVDKRNKSTRSQKRVVSRNHQEQRSKTSQQHLNFMSTPPTLKRTIR